MQYDVTIFIVLHSSGSVSSSNYYKLYSPPPVESSEYNHRHQGLNNSPGEQQYRTLYKDGSIQHHQLNHPPVGNPYITHSGQVPDYGGGNRRYHLLYLISTNFQTQFERISLNQFVWDGMEELYNTISFQQGTKRKL